MKSTGSYIIFSILALTILPAVMCAEDVNIDTQDGHISSQSDIRQGNSTEIIFNISGDAEITANTALHGTAELTNGTDTLVTEYKLNYVYHGSNQTTEYTGYDTFLSPPVNIIYVPSDSEVKVTLYVKASNAADDVADFGTYTATQTLTITWTGQ